MADRLSANELAEVILAFLIAGDVDDATSVASFESTKTYERFAVDIGPQTFEVLVREEELPYLVEEASNGRTQERD